MSSTAMVTHISDIVSRLKEELHAMQEVYSYVGEVVKIMGKNRVLVKLSH
jgi:ATP-dependent 26S proteasome regulatory subunit